MAKTIDYYFSVASPWTYLGSRRFIEMAARHRAKVNVRPLDLTRVFASSGGLLFEKRAPQRQSYRQLELARWRNRLDIALNLEPKFYPVDRRPASYLLIAGRRRGLDILELSDAILAAIWRDERNIADQATLIEIAGQAGYPGRDLAAAALDPSIAEAYERDTDAAIAAQVFGAPTYRVDGELFWGQDRLDFLEEKLSS